ncbi:hypothetical protein DRQ26_00355 [bacterium]|nr:MAG: hypothetical protein DRQ26_00355 [bacterium]
MRKPIISILTIILLLSFSTCYSQSRKPLYILILLDASGSMRDTDPDQLRKLAAQTTITLLSGEDRIAIAEFSDNGKILSSWLSPNDREKLFDAVSRAGDNGQYTDFRAALSTAIKIFKNAPQKSRKMVLLLSDGLFEPNLESSIYAPYHIDYGIAKTGKGKTARRQLRKKFTQKVLPVAMRMIREDIVPDLRKRGIEVFTVALGENADREFLSKVASETSKNPTELHSFEVSSPLQLVDAFAKILQYAQNRFILQSTEGKITAAQDEIFIDEFIKNPVFIIVSDDKSASFSITSPSNEEETAIPHTHPALKLFPVSDELIPGKWRYGFSSGSGRFKMLVVGESSLWMKITGLRERYAAGETISISVDIMNRGENAIKEISEESKITANIYSAESKSPEILPLKKHDDSFEAKFSRFIPGQYKINFDFEGFTKQGGKILPRRSRTYIFTVLPRVFVEPEVLSFGDVCKGDTLPAEITIHYGLDRPGNVEISGKIVRASRPPADSTRLPSIAPLRMNISPGEIFKTKIFLTIPKNSKWGDYEGEISVSVNDKPQKIVFYAHIPSLWEKIRIPLFAFIIILLVIVFAFLMYRIRLGRPRGILYVKDYPEGYVLSDIELSKVKGGFLRRFFSRHPHIVVLARRKADVILRGASPGAKIELIFYRIPNTRYVRNASEPKSEIEIKIVEYYYGEGEKITIEPGRTILLKDGQEIEFEGYKFKYECFG